jgi:hypothetical protein
MSSTYGNILPTQTYISKDKPQYISVFDPVIAAGGVLISPAIFKSQNGVNSSIISVNNTTGDTVLQSTVGDLDLNPGIGGSVTLGISGTPGGTVVKVSGDNGEGRVYDSLYNVPPSQVTIDNIYTYDVPGNQRRLIVPLPGDVDLLSLSAGKYMFNAWFRNLVIPITTSTLDMYFVPNGSPGSIIPFSQVRLNRVTTPDGAGSYATAVTGMFQITASGLYNFIFATDGSTTPAPADEWTSDIWRLQLVKF